MPDESLIEAARLAAYKYGLDATLVCAVCEQESGWNTNAMRFEPEFKERYIVPLGLSEPEATLRATSFGLMQVLGEVAREFGYLQEIKELCIPTIGLDIGCKVLAHKIQSAGNVTVGLLRYNGGARPAYAAEVIARMARYQTAAIDPSLGVDA